MTTQEIIELAGHRQVPPWVMKLVGDCLEKEREECAKLADVWVRAYDHPSETIARSIRTRENTTQVTPQVTPQDQKREWVGLTPEELSAIWDSMGTWNSTSAQHFYNAIWKAIKEKNT